MMATAHSLERAKQRIGCNSKKAAHLFRTALTRGKTADDFSGLERGYLREKKAHGCDVRVFNGYVYIINGETIVTVYRIPRWFGKTAKRRSYEETAA